MKKIFKYLTIMLILVFLVTACAPKESEVVEPEVEAPEVVEEPAEEEEPTIEPLRIAIVSPSAINDFAFTQSIYDAMIALQLEFGEEAIDFVYSENMFVVDDAAAAIRDYASQGFDLVLACRSRYGATLKAIAPDFPGVRFAWGT
jgi:basic membrane protein A